MTIVPVYSFQLKEVRIYLDKNEWSAYLYMEGNFSCDCNRHLFFFNRESTENCPCGTDKFQIPFVVLDNGKEEEIDGGPPEIIELCRKAICEYQLQMHR